MRIENASVRPNEPALSPNPAPAAIPRRNTDAPDPGESCVRIPDGYRLVMEGSRAGLYFTGGKGGEEGGLTRLGDPLVIRGMTWEPNNRTWGVLVEWHDFRGRRFVRNFSRKDLMGRQWYSELVNGGWDGALSHWRLVADYLLKARSDREITCVSRIGWINNSYILPHKVFGDRPGSIMLEGDDYGSLYTKRGTAEGWKELTHLCCGNTRLTFALCIAFAGPLLALADMEGGGFSLEGASSSGKSTALLAAASVWGGPAHYRTWRATDNGLEKVCPLFNDSLLVLDEVGEMDNPRALSACAYMIANGEGKTRHSMAGKAADPLRWRTIFLSSGEIGLADSLRQGGIRVRAGQEIRFLGIPTEAGDITDLHDLPHAGVLSERVKTLARENYGHAGRAFLSSLVEKQAMIRKDLVPRIESTAIALCPRTDLPQVRRAAKRFALAGYAGKLARSFGILPAAMDIEGSLIACYDAWYGNCTQLHVDEEDPVVEQAQLYLQQYGSSRYQNLLTPGRKPGNCVGFFMPGEDRTTYYMTSAAFKKYLIPGFPLKQAVSALARAGLLVLSGNGRYTVRKYLPGIGSTWVYQLQTGARAEGSQPR